MSIFRKVELSEETDEPVVEVKQIERPVVEQSIDFNSKINENLIKIIENIVEKYLNKKLNKDSKPINSKPKPIKPKLKSIKPIKTEIKPWYFPK